MLGFILLVLLLTSIWIVVLISSDLSDVKQNWPKYRCRPSIIPFAAFFGYDAGENFNFCLKNMATTEFGQALGPVFTILGSIASSLMVLITAANSIRLAFATMMGGVNTIFSNFTERFSHLTSNISQSATRIKFLMGRLYGAFFAMIYMAIAGMTALQNFGDTALFSFLDTFCFDPDTLVDIQGKGLTAVRHVQIGDVFTKTGGVVSATFQFSSDGQPMVRFLDGTVVSTNHYMEYKNKIIRAEDHPDAVLIGGWNGGKEKPLICFNTSDHHIPVGNYIFMDYDETEEGDQATMNWVDSQVNGRETRKARSYEYSSALHPMTKIKLKNGSTKPLQEIQLHDQLSTGKVIGVIQKEIHSSCSLSPSLSVAPGTLVWMMGSHQWSRAADIVMPYPKKDIFISLVVQGTASIETIDGTMLRDYVEIHSPDAEQFYAKSLESASLVIAE